MSINATDEHFQFLDDVRDSGSVNIYLAYRPLADYFTISPAEARAIFVIWARTFDQAKSVEERVAEAHGILKEEAQNDIRR